MPACLRYMHHVNVTHARREWPAKQREWLDSRTDCGHSLFDVSYKQYHTKHSTCLNLHPVPALLSLVTGKSYTNRQAFLPNHCDAREA